MPEREGADRRGPVKVGLVVMAGGAGSRFGANKLLEPLLGRCVLEWTLQSLVRAAKDLEGEETSLTLPLLVTRYEKAAALGRSLGLPVLTGACQSASDSMKLGLSFFERAGTAGCMFAAGDQPLILARSVERMVHSFSLAPERIIRLRGEEPGSPVLFPARYFSALWDLKGDRGGSALIKRLGLSPLYVQAEEACELWDADTREDLARIEGALLARGGPGKESER